MENKEQEIEVVTGDGTDLELSPVFKHLTALKPKTKNENEKKKPIVIPEVKKKTEDS